MAMGVQNNNKLSGPVTAMALIVLTKECDTASSAFSALAIGGFFDNQGLATPLELDDELSIKFTCESFLCPRPLDTIFLNGRFRALSHSVSINNRQKYTK